VNLTSMREGDSVRDFYSKLPPPVLIGIEATGLQPLLLRLVCGQSIRHRRPATGSQNSCFAGVPFAWWYSAPDRS
jgi:hypothetical protein